MPWAVAGLDDKLSGYKDLKDFVASLEKPRCALHFLLLVSFPEMASLKFVWFAMPYMRGTLKKVLCT